MKLDSEMCLAFVVLLLLIMIASSFLGKLQAQHGRLPPGPMPLPVLGSLLSLRNPLHRHFASLTKIYGPIIHIKLGLVSCIVVNSSDMAREVLRAHDVEFAYRPLSKFGEYFSFRWKDVVLAPYGESWKNMKMITAQHLLSPSRLDAAAAYQESEMALVVKDVGRLATASKVINLKHFIDKFVSGAFCQVLFGKRDVPVVDLISLIEKQTLSINVGKFIRPLDCLDLHGVNRRMRDDLMPKLESLLADIIQEHKQYKLDIESSGQEFIPKDWTVLLSLQDAADNNLSDISIMALLTVSIRKVLHGYVGCLFQDLVAAGIDNMKGAVEWAMAEVIQNPPVMQKAQEEIQDAIGTERLLRPSDVPGLPYMHAILKEVLRLHPTGPLGVPHFNPTEAVLAGYRIPKGSTVLINIWAIGRDPKHWLDPEDFRPERFQGTEIKVVGQEAQLEMIPFSAGRRMCPGHPVAVRFIPFAVASLIHAFDWSLPPDQNSVDLMEKGGTIASKLASELTAVASPRLSCKSLYERGIQLPQSLTLIANANRFPEPLAPIFLWFWDLNQSNLWYLPGGSRSCLACDFPKNEAAIIRSRRTRTASHIFGINPMEDVKNPSSTSLQEDTTYGYTSFLGHTTTRSTKSQMSNDRPSHAYDHMRSPQYDPVSDPNPRSNGMHHDLRLLENNEEEDIVPERCSTD